MPATNPARSTLRLVLTHHWYDEIAADRKRVEYRAMTPHWNRRIGEAREQITRVTFSRGYSSTTLSRGVTHIDTGPCPYEGWDGEFWRLHLYVLPKG